MRYLLALLLLCIATPALAQQGAINLDTCAPGPAHMPVSRIVMCVSTIFMNASINFLDVLLGYLEPAILAALTMAVIFTGIKMTFGIREFTKISSGFILRLGITLGILFALGQLAAYPFIILDDMATMMFGQTPWGAIDSALGRLFGFGSATKLHQGMVGIIGASLFSGTASLLGAITGGLMFIAVLGLMLRAIYTYLLAVLLLAFCVVISPMVIPMLVFQFGERYVMKWFSIIVGAIIMPMMLFAAFGIFMVTVNTSIDSTFQTLGGNDFRQFWRNNNPVAAWGVMNDPRVVGSYASEPGLPSTQSFTSPILGKSADANVLRLPGIDFGTKRMPGANANLDRATQHNTISQELALKFAGMMLLCFLLRSLIDTIPEMADQIAGMSTRIDFESMTASFKQGIGGMFGKGTG